MSITPQHHRAPLTPVTVFRSVRRWPSSRPWLRGALLVALPLVLAACSKPAPAGPGAPGGLGAAGGAPPPPEVTVITARAATQPITLEYAGQTAGSRETEVRARVGGILQKRLYVEGATVKAGAPLFQIDPASIQNQLASAAAAVAIAEARVNQARRDQTRLAPLVLEKAISQKEFDDSKSTLELAEATLKQSEAQASEARLNLSYTRVVAPISGVTAAAAKSDGSLLTASDSLLTSIVQTDPMYVNFSVSEADYLRLNQQVNSGQLTVSDAAQGKRAANGSLALTAQVKLADGSLHPRAGKLNFASEKVNAQNGSFDVRAEIPNPDGSLRPGQFVRVLLSGANRPNTLSVPQRAVIDSPFGKMVFVVSKDNKLEPRPVELDGWTQGEWIVTKGIKDGDSVLVEGFIKAHDPGMTVKPVPYVPGKKPLVAPANPAQAASK